MALPMNPYVRSTVFILDADHNPIGTGFFQQYSQVGMNDAGQVVVPVFDYLVTAFHVIQHHLDRSFVRIRSRDGRTVDLPVGRWYFDDASPLRTDIAVGLSPELPVDFDLGLWGTPQRLMTRKQEPLAVGYDVYFAGLLTHVPTMGVRAIPMVRSGRLGAWNQSDVPFQPEGLDDEAPILIDAHLIDCYGYYGFSGAPCFVVTKNHVALLGVLVGFFNYLVDGRYEFPVNAGVGIVVPAWKVEEIIRHPELKARRVEGLRTARPAGVPIDGLNPEPCSE